MSTELTLFNEKIDLDNKFPINARTLHANLQVGRDFSTWLKDRIDKYGFTTGKNYIIIDSPNMGNQIGKGGDRRSIAYRLTIGMAKELAIVENNAKGSQIRKQLIDLEEAWAAIQTSDDAYLKMTLQMNVRSINILESRLEKAKEELAEKTALLKIQEPIVEYFDKYLDRAGVYSMQQAAKKLAPDIIIGRQRLIDFLKEHMAIFRSNQGIQPYQKYVDAGYFILRPSPFVTAHGHKAESDVTYITPRGIDWIGKLLENTKFYKKEKKDDSKTILEIPAGKDRLPALDSATERKQSNDRMGRYRRSYAVNRPGVRRCKPGESQREIPRDCRPGVYGPADT